MNSKQSRLRALTRCLIVLPALVVGASLAFTAAASAQTAVPFQANVNGKNGKKCPTTANYSLCGSANIAGYGPATYTLNVTGNGSASGNCGRTGLVSLFTYTATTTFTLLSDGSTLVLDENGLVCAPGNSATNSPPHARGFPYYVSNSNWTVDPLSNGQFSGLTGSGTDSARSAGTETALTYSGTLLEP